MPCLGRHQKAAASHDRDLLGRGDRLVDRNPINETHVFFARPGVWRGLEAMQCVASYVILVDQGPKKPEKGHGMDGMGTHTCPLYKKDKRYRKYWRT